MFDHDYFEGVLPDTRVSKCVKLVVGEDQTEIKIKLLKNSFVIFKKNGEKLLTKFPLFTSGTTITIFQTKDLICTKTSFRRGT